MDGRVPETQRAGRFEKMPPAVSNSCSSDVVGAFLLLTSWLPHILFGSLLSPLEHVLAFKSLTLNSLTVAAAFPVGPWYICYL